MIVEVNDEKEIREYPVEALRFRKKKRYDKMSTEDTELKKLEALEQREGKSKIDD